MAKLTWGEVKEIRANYANGQTQSRLGKIFLVDRSSISYVVNRKTWVGER